MTNNLGQGVTVRLNGTLTSYKLDQKTYSSYVIGNSLSEIRTKIELRGLDETIDSQLQQIETIQSFNSLSDDEFLRELPIILHTACFLSFIALKSKSASVIEILGDEGILHELIHLMTETIPVTKESIKEIRNKMTILHQKAIGTY